MPATPSRGFDLLAPHYRWMERVLAGSRLQECRTKYLSAISNARRILLLGEGPGKFLRACSPKAEITCLDSSAKMLDEARKAVGDSNANFVHADVLNYSFGSYDAVVTHFFLDCFRPEQLQALVPRIAGALSSGGVWLLADFRLPERGPQRWRAAIILKMMYVFFRVATRLPACHLTNPDPYLQQNGLTLVERHTSDWGLLHTDLWRKV